MAMQANIKGIQAASSSSQKQLVGRNIFLSNWQLTEPVTLRNGTQVLAQYNINEPTNAPAHFNMLLDASGSMFQVAHAGKYVYEHLFECFEELVVSGKALRPDDKICVWSFNKRAKLLCEVETKNYHRKKEHIRKEYRKELLNDSWNGNTHLYDAVAHVMDEKILKTWSANKNADYFLVAFTDGRDTGTGTTPLEKMMAKLMELVGRLHTYFITVNLPKSSGLQKRLAQQQEMELIPCESTNPRDISRAFTTVRDRVKAVLSIVTLGAGAGAVPTMTRIVEYGDSRESVADNMMNSLAKMAQGSGSLVAAFNKLQLTHK